MTILNSAHRSSPWSVALTSLACLLGAAAASADPDIGKRSVTVNYRDLDLSTIAGATALYQRLRGAAHQVCDGPATGLAEYQDWRNCYEAAMADAVAKINSPRLSTLLHGRGKPATKIAMLER